MSDDGYRAIPKPSIYGYPPRTSTYVYFPAGTYLVSGGYINFAACGCKGPCQGHGGGGGGSSNVTWSWGSNGISIAGGGGGGGAGS